MAGAPPKRDVHVRRDVPDGVLDALGAARPGARIAVHADDLPQDRFEGAELALGPDEIVILRENAECGAIALHFPRAGYRIVRG